jgi:catalase
LRLGGPNFHEIPINAPIAQAHNNQRDGFHRQSIHRGRVSYEPNSLGGGCPFQAGVRGFTSFPEPVSDHKVRGKPEKFGDHYSQATLFWNSQVPYEKAHIIRGFRFELTKVQVPAIRERTVSMLRNVSDELAKAVADGLGMPLPRPMPRVVEPVRSEVTASPALSLTYRPGDGSIRGRKVAILAAGGVHGPSLARAQTTLSKAGAVVRLLAARLGSLETADGETVEPDATFETMPSVLFDAVLVPDGDAAADELISLGHAREFLRDQFRHGKPIVMLGAGERVVAEAGVPTDDPSDWALVRDLDAFVGAIGKHRNWDRPTDPPRV